jgi:hypothetical protein
MKYHIQCISILFILSKVLLRRLIFYRIHGIL